MAKSKKLSSTKKAVDDLTRRLGPVRKVVRMTRAKDTDASFNLFLACDHVRRGTKRATVRCGRCKAGK
jgi:hypothetical protein